MKAKHKTEVRERPIKETICAQPRCKFKGKHAVQGVCFNDKGELADWDKLDAHDRELTQELRQMRKRTGRSYTVHLETYYVCAMMNWQLTLDECIRLRRDNALLRRSKR